MTAAALAEYMILSPDGQGKVLHNCRFSSAFVTSPNAPAVRALRAYNSDPRRDIGKLEEAKETLTTKARAEGTTPKGKDDALRCIEIVDLFLRHENTFGMRKARLEEAANLDPIDIEGVRVSVQPDLFVYGPKDTVGAAFIRVAKAPDPAEYKRRETQERYGEYRREMAAYLISLLQIQMEAQGGRFGIPDRKLSFVADIRLGERIDAAPDHARRVKDLRGACRQITAQWPLIEPNPSILRRR